MEELEKYANKLKSQYPDLTEDIDQILGDTRIDLDNWFEMKESIIQKAYRLIDELL